ncbi:MAG TPA: hypothetical protein VK934_12005 [Fimbriimonas sp.]|nr:hypothetical protein [Fimbriimonas sp.]
MGSEDQTKREPIAPPQSLSIKRRFKFYPTQALGLPLIALLPLLALFRVFDTTLETAKATQNGLTLVVRYPVKLRHRTIEPMQLSVRNDSHSVREKIELKVNREFIQRFRDASFNPNITEVDEQSYIVEFLDVMPGELRTLEIDLEAATAGTLTAHCSAKAGESEVGTDVSTWIYP